MTLAEQFRTRAIEQLRITILAEQNRERDRVTYDAIIEMCRIESENGRFYENYIYSITDKVLSKLKADGFVVKKNTDECGYTISWVGI